MKRICLAIMQCAFGGVGIVGAIGTVAFAAVNIIGVEGASWGDVGMAMVLLGVGCGMIVWLDRFEVRR